MALYKNIRQEDGVMTNYHRVLQVIHTTNSHNTIAVVSYVDDSVRADERVGIIGNPYKAAKTYETDYDDTMTAEKAYDFLKTLSDFEGATDV